MKVFYAAILLCCSLTLSAEWGIRLNVHGHGKVELAPAHGEKYVHNIFWGEEQTRKYSLYVQKKGFPDEGETTFSFSFLPKQSGKVILELSGCLVQQPKIKVPDKAFVHYLLVRADGCTIRNGDFRERNAAGNAVGWSFFGGAKTLPQGVEAWQRGGIRQQIAVKGGEVVTVTIVARKGRYEKAVPPPPCTSSTAGIVMNRSATLNVENHGMQIMSITSPVAMRSMRLPIAPPVMAAISQSSVFLRICFFAMAQTMKTR